MYEILVCFSMWNVWLVHPIVNDNFFEHIKYIGSLPDCDSFVTASV